MKLRTLPMVALAGALLASPAFAGDTDAGAVTPRSRTPQSDTQSQPGVPGGSTTDTQAPMPKSIEGRVAVVEPESGRFVLDTAEGPVTLMTTPEELAGIKVGDIIRVSLETNDSR